MELLSISNPYLLLQNIFSYLLKQRGPPDNRSIQGIYEILSKFFGPFSSDENEAAIAGFLLKRPIKIKACKSVGKDV